MTPRLFGGSKSARGNDGPRFSDRDEARRRFLQQHLLHGYAERVAARIGEPASFVYRRVEGHAALTPALELELLREIPPAAQIARLRADAGALGYAVAEIPTACGLQSMPSAQLAAALVATAKAAEASIDAMLDGIVTPAEALTVREDADKAHVLIANAVATMEVAAGGRLL